MYFRSLFAAILAVGLIALSGCGPAKLNVKRDLKFDSVESARAIDLPKQTKPQTLTVEFSSPSEDVSVYVFKEEDAPGEDGILTANSKKALGGKTASRGETFTVEIPANTPTRVIVRAGGKKADVSLKLSN